MEDEVVDLQLVSEQSPVIYVNWNPWHGCTKVSPGCKYCYVYRQDAMYDSNINSSRGKKNKRLQLPIKRKRDKRYKISSGSIVFTCFTSDFLIKDADQWRDEAWKMISARKDLMFFFFTKRIERFIDIIPSDWGDGYDNVIVGCTVENQERCNFRLPIFKSLPIKHKAIIIAPMLERIDISQWLDNDIVEVSTSGESGDKARICDYEWILDIRRQCIEHNVPFSFHQTGAKFLKDGKLYSIKRKHQISQAKKANIDFRIGKDYNPI
jgi:Bacteriophage protein gp37